MQMGQHVTPTIRLVRPLGQGAMGCVWVADHLTLETQVAVKFMARAYVQHQEFAARFQREAQAAAQLRSPHVAQVFDHGVTPEGEPFIVMELLHGESLQQRLLRSGQLPVEQVVQLVEQAAKALSRAHQLGIVHRDIKPDNLFLIDVEGDPFVKVLDFGIAKMVHSDVPGMTATGAMLGTPLYMSPEQFISAKHIDHRADLWALAVVAYLALTGRVPFEGDTLFALARSVRAGKFPSPSALRPDLPAALDAWMERALHRDASLRFESALQMAQAFEDAAQMKERLIAPKASTDAAGSRAADVRKGARPRIHQGKEAAFDTEAIRRLFSRPSSGGEQPERGIVPAADEPRVKITDSSWEDAKIQSISIPGTKPSAVELRKFGWRLYASFSPGLALCWEIGTRSLRWCRQSLQRPLCLAKATGEAALAVGCGDGVIRLLDSRSGQTSRTLEGHGESVRAVAMSPTGQRLASGSDDKTVRLWSTLDGELLHTAREHSDSVTSVAFSPRGVVVASCGNDSTIRLWDKTLQPIRALRGFPGGVNSVAFSPSGNFLAAGCGDSTIRIWEIGKYEQPVRVLEGHTQRVISVAFGGRGDTLASGSADCTIRLWNVITGKLIRILPRHGAAVERVVMSPHVSHVASVCEDGIVRVFRFQHAEG